MLAALSLSGVPGGSRACAQGMRGRIIGVVTDSAGALGIAGADISIDGTSIHAVSDERGEFRLIGGSGAGTVLRIRRLGFRPQTLSITSSGDVADVHIYLVPAAQFLAPVVVHGERTRYLGRLAGYYERLEKRTSGQFITRADIERDRPGVLTQLLARMPGVQIVRGKGAFQRNIRMRGRNCAPLVWLDGVAMRAGDVSSRAGKIGVRHHRTLVARRGHGASKGSEGSSPRRNGGADRVVRRIQCRAGGSPGRVGLGEHAGGALSAGDACVWSEWTGAR